jgi:hypothetical protein
MAPCGIMGRFHAGECAHRVTRYSAARVFPASALVTDRCGRCHKLRPGALQIRVGELRGQ